MPDARRTKLSTFVEPEWVPHRYERVFWREETTGGGRLVAAVSEGQVETLLQLAAPLEDPVALLWVLHTPRGGSDAGRYQSPLLTGNDVRRVLRQYRSLFEEDARSDLWIHSPSHAATLVLDRHDLLFGYGAVDLFAAALQGAGFRDGRATIPSPHAHEYHPAFDELERALAAEFEWHLTGLRPEDEQ